MDCGEGGLSRLWDGLTTKPAVWAFGHFHRLHDRMVDATRFICVGCSDGTDGRPTPMPVIYDTVERALTVHRE